MRFLLTVLAIAVATSASAEALKDVKGYKALGDGLYTIPDRSLACRVYDEAVACANSRLTVVCNGKECQGREERSFPRELWVRAKDAHRRDARVLPSGTFADFGSLACRTRRTYIDCSISDYGGGFQMSGLFTRVIAIDNTPSRTWPWDGKRYARKDMQDGTEGTPVGPGPYVRQDPCRAHDQE